MISNAYDDSTSDSSSSSLEDYFFVEDGMDNCVLTDDELKQISTPSQQSWKDFLPMNFPAIVTINASKDQQWKLAKKEITHVRKRMREMMDVDDDDNKKEATRKMICFFNWK